MNFVYFFFTASNSFADTAQAEAAVKRVFGGETAIVSASLEIHQGLRSRVKVGFSKLG